MQELLMAYGAGMVSGSRSMLGLTMAATSPTARALTIALAAAEMVADKSARIPARISPGPLAGRLVTGALAGAGCARNGSRVPAALAGAAGAATGAHLLYHARRLATERLGVPPLVAALAEDALAIGSSLLLARCR
jgi:uncharacterized membrane protein